MKTEGEVQKSLRILLHFLGNNDKAVDQSGSSEKTLTLLVVVLNGSGVVISSRKEDKERKLEDWFVFRKFQNNLSKQEGKKRQVFITKSLENQFPGFEWSFNSISTIETYISMIFQDFIIAFPALSKV